MNRELEDDKTPIEGVENSQPKTLMAINANEPEPILSSEREFNTSQKSLQVTEGDEKQTNEESLDGSNPKKINCSPPSERDPKRDNISVQSEKITVPANPYEMADNLVLIKVSSLEFTETGEIYLKTLIMALESKYLNANSFCKFLTRMYWIPILCIYCHIKELWL